MIFGVGILGLSLSPGAFFAGPPMIATATGVFVPMPQWSFAALSLLVN